MKDFSVTLFISNCWLFEFSEILALNACCNEILCNVPKYVQNINYPSKN